MAAPVILGIFYLPVGGWHQLLDGLVARFDSEMLNPLSE